MLSYKNSSHFLLKIVHNTQKDKILYAYKRWYDNEWAYSVRVVDLCKGIGNFLWYQESIILKDSPSCTLLRKGLKHFPIPLRKSLKVIAEGDFLVFKRQPQSNTQAFYK